MKKSLPFPFLLMLICTKIIFSQFSVTLLRSIGDERDDYTFFDIRTAAIADDATVYVGDVGGYFLAKYGPDGKFIKRFGRSGQGPNEFLFLDSLRISEQHLFLSDIKNLRIAKIDKNLLTMDTFRLGYIQLRGSFHVLPENRFFATFSSMKESKGKGRAAIFNKKGEMECCFFTKDQWGEYVSEKNDLSWALKQTTAKILSGYSLKRNELIIGYEYPEPPSAFFIYNLEGKEVTRFFIKHDKTFRFPDYYHRFDPQNGFSAKEIHLFLRNRRIISYKDYILVFSEENETRIKKDPVIIRSFCKILDPQGHPLGEFILPAGLVVFDVNSRGLMVSANPLDNDPKLYVHRLNF